MRNDSTPVRILTCELPHDRPKREAERAAVKTLLKKAFGDSNLTHDAAGRPLIDGYSISISHSRTHAALAIAPPDLSVGIDIEENAEKTARVIRRVLRGPNSDRYTNPLQAWTLLEAAFKATRDNAALTLPDFILPAPGETAITIEGRPEVQLSIHASHQTDFGWLSVVTSPLQEI